MIWWAYLRRRMAAVTVSVVAAFLAVVAYLIGVVS